MTPRKTAGAALSLMLAAGTFFLTLVAIRPKPVPYCGDGCARFIQTDQIMSAGFAVFGVMLIAMTIRQTGLAPWRKTLLTIILVALVVSVTLISLATTKSMNPAY